MAKPKYSGWNEVTKEDDNIIQPIRIPSLCFSLIQKLIDHFSGIEFWHFAIGQSFYGS